MPDPQYLLDRMTGEEIAKWEAFYRIAPWGNDYVGYMIAQLNKYFVQAHKKGGGEVKTTDFMPFYRDLPPTPQEISSVIGQAKALARGNNRKP